MYKLILGGFSAMNDKKEWVDPQGNLWVRATAEKSDKGNGAYVAWFVFYFFFFSIFTVGVAISFYIVTISLAFSKAAEKLWRNVSGIRPLRLRSEKERLLPLFRKYIQRQPTPMQIYLKKSSSISRKI